jgi:D-3-phosphoglycerate dehydrogenase
MLTPHIGASTAEAQRNVAVDVCAAVRDALLSGDLSRSINAAGAAPEGRWRELQPALLVARRAAAVARALLADQGARVVQRLTVRCGADLAGSRDALLAAAALGALDGVVAAERLNVISARAVAESRGLELSAAEGTALPPASLEVSVSGSMHEVTVAGSALPGAPPRLTRIGDFHVDVAPRETLVVLTNRDVPGVIGRVGTMLGDSLVNIAEYHQARLSRGGDALAAISVDGPADASLRQRLLDLPDVQTATIVTFR